MLHLTVNPASEARLSLRQDRARLQAECERLREALGSLERGGPVPAGLEAVFVPSSKEVAGRAPAPGGRRVCVRLSVLRGPSLTGAVWGQQGRSKWPQPCPTQELSPAGSHVRSAGPSPLLPGAGAPSAAQGPRGGRGPGARLSTPRSLCPGLGPHGALWNLHSASAERSRAVGAKEGTPWGPPRTGRPEGHWGPEGHLQPRRHWAGPGAPSPLQRSARPLGPWCCRRGLLGWGRCPARPSLRSSLRARPGRPPPASGLGRTCVSPSP